MAPQVSISILNYQRKDTLRLAIKRALGQEYPDLEVLVVDNASTDGSDRMVREEFPAVRLIRLSDNLGCAARNRGVRAARGEIVITIDNDVMMVTSKEVQKVVDAFARYPTAACVNFQILDSQGDISRRDWCHPKDLCAFADKEFLTDSVLEGASAFRRKAYDQVGGYWGPLFLGHEGVDLALRLLDAGHDLLYVPCVRMAHLVSPEARPSTRIYYTFTRNSIWLALRNHRIGPGALSISRDMTLMAFSSLRAGQIGSYVRAVRDAVVGSCPALASRKPLDALTYRRLRHIRSQAPSLFAKARRHWRDKPI